MPVEVYKTRVLTGESAAQTYTDPADRTGQEAFPNEVSELHNPFPCLFRRTLSAARGTENRTSVDRYFLSCTILILQVPF